MLLCCCRACVVLVLAYFVLCLLCRCLLRQSLCFYAYCNCCSCVVPVRRCYFSGRCFVANEAVFFWVMDVLNILITRGSSFDALKIFEVEAGELQGS